MYQLNSNKYTKLLRKKLCFWNKPFRFPFHWFFLNLKWISKIRNPNLYLNMIMITSVKTNLQLISQIGFTFSLLVTIQHFFLGFLYFLSFFSVIFSKWINDCAMINQNHSSKFLCYPIFICLPVENLGGGGICRHSPTLWKIFCKTW